MQTLINLSSLFLALVAAWVNAAPASDVRDGVFGSKLPYESRYVDGELLRYVDNGQGQALRFLYGNPTSSYLWRNVTPYVGGLGRVVALDNIGYGKSAKPDLDYRRTFQNSGSDAGDTHQSGRLTERPREQTDQSMEESAMSDSKVYMLNALWFKEGGAAAYAKYGEAAGPIVEALGGRRLDGFVPTQSLIGDWQPDLLFIVEWPNWETFLQLGQSEEYQKIAHLREVGLENSLLIRMDRLP